MKRKPCLNCQNLLEADHHFCSACGQSVKEANLSLSDILSDTFNNFLSFDSKLLRTLRDLYKPAHLTTVYVQGQRGKYVRPGRMFLFFLLAAISFFLLQNEFEFDQNMIHERHQETYAEETQAKFDSLAQVFADTTGKTALTLDSIRTNLFKTKSDTADIYFGKGITLIGKDMGEYQILKKDAVLLTPNEVIEKYKIEGFLNRLQVKQFLKIANDPAGGLKYIVKNLSWVLIVLVFLSALTLKVLYIRKQYYFVEHLVLILYGHIGFLVVTILVSLLGMVFGGADVFMTIGLLVVLVMQYTSLLQYYKQSRMKTFVKWMAFNLVYMFMFVVIFLLIALISFLIF